MKQTKQSIMCLALILQMLFIGALHLRADNNESKIALRGTVTSKNQAVPYACVVIANTSIGTVTNVDGLFNLKDLPKGQYTVKVQSMGYKPVEKAIELSAEKTYTLNFVLEEDVFGLEQVVVTADRNEQKRKNASTIVNRLSNEKLNKVQPVVVSDALSYVPGLRTETNCQNCGMVQVRMNGLEGHYSQILINSRPIFSGLVGVYGLELMPTSMIERVEVIRGGGSALYGSNAIAGTINIITKEPLQNTFDAKIQQGLIGVGMDGVTMANETIAEFNTSIVSNNKKTGMALFGSLRQRDPFDANKDDFSELMKLKNQAFGTRLYHRPSYRSKVVVDFFRINEERRGGNKFESLFHEAELTEAVQHNITTAAINYEYFIASNAQLSLYTSAQDVERRSYYGSNFSLADYGQTDGLTYTFGGQFKTEFGANNLLTGVEMIGDRLKDQKLGFPKYDKPIYNDDNEIIDFEHAANTTVAKQEKAIYGAFIQYDRLLGKVKLSAGLRYDYYNIVDQVHGTGNCSGSVISPRANILWHVTPQLQARASYSQGYRAPQIFDEDLHISASGSRQVVHKNAEGLEQETSHSFMASLDYNGKIALLPFSILAEGFYTYLDNAFVTNPEDVENGVVTYFRTNAIEGAFVQGVNLEANVAFRPNLMLNAGFTFQQSKFKEAQELGTTDFLRTPNNYGFFTLDWDITKQWCLVASGQYTGTMPIAYYNQHNTNPNYVGELRHTPEFFDFGLKAEYTAEIAQLPIQFYVGTKNIFNSFQSDFETGVDRDPTYIYGPALPRMVYVGIRITGITH